MNMKLYARDALYAFVEAALILYFAIVVINYNTPNQEGFFAGLIDGGDFVFTICVLIATVKTIIVAN